MTLGYLLFLLALYALIMFVVHRMPLEGQARTLVPTAITVFFVIVLLQGFGVFNGFVNLLNGTSV